MQDQPTKAPRRTKLKATTGVYRSISGAYEVSFRDSDGRLRFETLPKGSTLADAKALRADKVVRLQRGERVVTTRVTVDEYATETFFPALRVRERTQAITSRTTGCTSGRVSGGASSPRSRSMTWHG